MLHLPILLALVLSIVGGTRLSSSDVSTQNSGHTFTKAGVVIFLVSFIAIVALALLTCTQFGSLPWGEKRILYAVLASLPFLAVRLLYSLLADFKDDSTFNTVNGNATVQLCMAIIEEFIVVVFYLISGFVAPALNKVMGGGGGVPMNGFHGQKAGA